MEVLVDRADRQAQNYEKNARKVPNFEDTVENQLYGICQKGDCARITIGFCDQNP